MSGIATALQCEPAGKGLDGKKTALCVNWPWQRIRFSGYAIAPEQNVSDEVNAQIEQSVLTSGRLWA